VKFLVLGAGQIGYAVVYDLIRSPRVDKIALADCDADHLAFVGERLPDDRLVPCRIDVNNFDEVANLMSEVDVAISCVTYQHNYELSKAALQAGTNFCDLGGSEEILSRQFLLDELARERNMVIVPGCGLAPGLVSILAAAAAETMEEIYEIRLRVGDLPTQPQPPLNYARSFSIDWLINQYVEEATIIRDGKLMQVPSLSDLEQIHFPAPFHTLEAFATSGGIATLPQTFSGRVQHLDYKTIRYRGHCEQIKLLRDLGLFGLDPVGVDSTTVTPRDLMRTLLLQKLPSEEPDVVLLRIIVTGVKDEKPTQVVWDAVDYMDQAAGLSAMMRMTAFPASIVAQLIARGDITEKGVLALEKTVPAALFLAEMASRGVNLMMVEKVPERRH